MIPENIMNEPSWYESSARARINGLLDAGSFSEILGPQDKIMSPHLALFDLPPAFDDGMIIGRGLIDGRPVAVAAQEGQFMGGTFAEVSGAKLVGLLRSVASAAGTSQAVSTVVLLLDTGGVRLQEANAGEMAVSETIRAVLDVRRAGVPVVALIGGRAGAFGGGGLVTACCSHIVISEQGRISVSGPEVIETNKGVEEFDSHDRALVWRVTGGRSRVLLGGADSYVKGDISSFRQTAAQARNSAPSLSLETLEREQERLEQRLSSYGNCRDTPEIWTLAGLPTPDKIADLTEDELSASWQRGEGVMMPDNLLSALFPEGHTLSLGAENTLSGRAKSGGREVEVLGISGGTPLGPETAIILAGRVLGIVKSGSKAPIVFLIDTASQRMTRRDEMLGLNEYLAHLAKSIMLAGFEGHRTISVLYGTAAAGALIATALATQTMVAVDGAHPSVMDLPSIARVTKLSLDVLTEKAKKTPVFAPGVEPLAATGAVTEIWSLSDGHCNERLSALLADEATDGADIRDFLGCSRGGRKVAAEVSKRVQEAFSQVIVSEKAR